MLFAIIEHLTLVHMDIGRSRRFSKGVGQFKRTFQVKGDIAYQPFLVSEN